MRKELGIVILVGIVLLVIAFIVALLWFFTTYQGVVSDQKKHAEIIRIQASAQTYNGKLGFYTGVCKDVVFKDDYTCNDREDSFAAEVELEDGGYYCTDSTHFVGKTTASIGPSSYCEEQ